jgi:hypothetical protein
MCVIGAQQPKGGVRCSLSRLAAFLRRGSSAPHRTCVKRQQGAESVVSRDRFDWQSPPLLRRCGTKPNMEEMGSIKQTNVFNKGRWRNQEGRFRFFPRVEGGPARSAGFEDWSFRGLLIVQEDQATLLIL